MYVACPSCKSLYEIASVHLRAAGGQLRCGDCQTTFDATAAVFDSPQQALEYADAHPLPERVVQEIDELVSGALNQISADESINATAADESSEEPVAEVRAVVGAASQSNVAVAVVPQGAIETAATEEAEAITEPGPETEPVLAEAPLAEAAVAAPDEVGPELAALDVVVEEPQLFGAMPADIDFYAHPAASEFLAPQPEATAVPPELSAELLYPDEAHDRVSVIPWSAIAASLLLTVLLGAQFAWAERYQLARIPPLRPVLELFCKPLDCDLPLRHEASKLEMLEREVIDHPQVSGALLINASFANRAGFVQAYPVFQVSFSDFAGTPVAVRRFQPREYLTGQQDVASGMAPGAQVEMLLEVLDPGDRAVSFQFDFL